METVKQADQNHWNGCILGSPELSDSRTVRFSELLDNWIVRQSDSPAIGLLENCRIIKIVRLLICWKCRISSLKWKLLDRLIRIVGMVVFSDSRNCQILGLSDSRNCWIIGLLDSQIVG